MGFYFPHGPADMVMPETTQVVLTSVLIALCALFLARAVADWRRSGTLIGVVLIFGGFVSSINEANVDALGLVWHPRIGEWAAYETIGPVPLWVPFAYMLFEGGMAYTLYKRVQAGMTTKQLWKAFAVVYLANATLELPLLALDFYDYYGNPPLEFFGFPLFWPFLNLPALFITVAMLTRLPQAFRGWRVLLLLVEPAMAYGAVSAAAGWPVFAVLHMEARSEVVNQLGGLATIGLSVMLINLMISFIASDGANNRKAVPANRSDVDLVVPELRRPVGV
jgi:hypothetical protein